ncbi:acetate/propionate family kinase [Candidatus Aalborgicola defluviihabitans]|jgi:acetate kinase|uniref:acetate/propionate family kinase n=1 Tax=Candidatus Aalborgicola defluviihabitans TaxID=3386187 RepID=UPI001DAFBA75|nr:acetate/propionate family kinase [Burkholderiales bacterium]MBK6570434.1 acetate/propionate family kinase [Burkholderiales bacterium]MBK7279432.1 acetate/propionate family kinase [Burkholderiales bacterium]MBK7312873.1 acetate/propionate family kinase [Burkholderiales bacterium]MBL0243686.1 acetate/propionate family kinase [Rhodoferax sp.]
MAILAVNAGSSSLKFSLYPRHADQILASVLSGSIQGLEPHGTPEMGWTFNGVSHQQLLQDGNGSTFERALLALRSLLTRETGMPAIEAVAHRVVHGGQNFRASVIVTDAILEQLARLNSLAPLHQPHNLAGVRAFRLAFPELPQIACFDTAYHATLAEEDYAFALPQSLSEQGVRRYGFHGLSYQFIMDNLLEHSPRARGRVVMAHLGNGASLCAATDAKSCSTTMGFSALDGLMMGTRTGALDPGVLLYLLEQGWDHQRLQTMLYQQSGLLGVSGISADMRRLRADGSDAARKAIALFTRRVVRASGALTACMGGLDVLAFSGGIGEHDAVLRSEVCTSLAYLGVQIDPALNQAAIARGIMAVHTPDSAVEVWVVPTDEGRVAAREAARLTA